MREVERARASAAASHAATCGGEGRLGQRLAACAPPAPRAGPGRRSRRDRGTSSPPGAARTAACRRGPGRARRFRAPAPASPPRCRTALRRSCRDAGRVATTSSLSVLRGQRVRRGARGQQAGVQARHPRRARLEEAAVEPDQPVRWSPRRRNRSRSQAATARNRSSFPNRVSVRLRPACAAAPEAGCARPR